MEIKELLDNSPLRVEEDAFLTHARQLLRDNNLRAIPVVDENEKVKGVLTRGGVLNITSSKSNIEVKSYVKKVPALTPTDSVKKTGIEMIKTNLESLPVVSSIHDPKLVGVVTIIDVFNSINEINVRSNELIEDIMSEKVETVEAGTPIKRCWRKIIETGYSGFPVTKDNKVIGMITRRDILDAGYARFRREDDSKSIGKSGPKVERIMSTPFSKVNKKTTVDEATEILIKKDIGRLPVTSLEKENELVGIVDRYDILDSYLR